MPVETPGTETILTPEAASPSLPAAPPKFGPETFPLVPRIITLPRLVPGVPQILSVPVAPLAEDAIRQAPENIGNGQ